MNRWNEGTQIYRELSVQTLWNFAHLEIDDMNQAIPNRLIERPTPPSEPQRQQQRRYGGLNRIERQDGSFGVSGLALSMCCSTAGARRPSAGPLLRRRGSERGLHGTYQ